MGEILDASTHLMDVRKVDPDTVSRPRLGASCKHGVGLNLEVWNSVVV